MSATDTPTSPPVTATPPAPGAFRRVMAEMGDLVLFSGRALRGALGTGRYGSQVLTQGARITLGTTVLLIVMSMFMAASVVNFAFFFLRGIGAADFTGLATGFGTPRLIAIDMFGYVVTAKIACGIVAEIGAARISEEIDAYEAEGIDPFRYVIGSRIMAVLLFVPIGAVAALFGSTIGSYVSIVWILQGQSAEGFFSVHWGIQSLLDQLFAVIAMATIALVTVCVACYYGYRTSGGPAAVGESVARSCVVNLVLVHLLAAFYVMLFYGSDTRLPIGG